MARERKTWSSHSPWIFMFRCKFAISKIVLESATLLWKEKTQMGSSGSSAWKYKNFRLRFFFELSKISDSDSLA